jgi:hypothetical protein
MTGHQAQGKCLSSMCEALGPVPSTAKQNKTQHKIRALVCNSDPIDYNGAESFLSPAALST